MNLYHFYSASETFLNEANLTYGDVTQLEPDQHVSGYMLIIYKNAIITSNGTHTYDVVGKNPLQLESYQEGVGRAAIFS